MIKNKIFANHPTNCGGKFNDVPSGLNTSKNIKYINDTTIAAAI